MDEYAQFLKDLFAQRNAGPAGAFGRGDGGDARVAGAADGIGQTRAGESGLGKSDPRERNSYSVNSRLIGAQVEARLYLDHVEVWYGQKKVEDLPRLRGRGKHRIDYRHIIEWLVRKPGAFENYRYQEDLFPTSRFRMAYDALRESTPVRERARST